MHQGPDLTLEGTSEEVDHDDGAQDHDLYKSPPLRRRDLAVRWKLAMVTVLLPDHGSF